MKTLLDKLRELIAGAEAEDENQEPEGDATDEQETPAGEDEAPAEVAVDEVADETQAAATDEEDETLPASEVSLEELRDSLNKLAIENEALRTRIAELGGDTEVTDDVEIEVEVEDEIEDDEDDEKAQTDIDTQLAEIAALRGDN